MSYIDTAIAEAVAASEETKVEEVKSEPVEAKEETEKTEGNTTEETAETQELDEVEQLKLQNKKIINANSRKEKKITKLAAERDMLRQRVAELEQRQATPAPREEDFVDKPYGDYLKAVARHEARLDTTEQALEAAKNQATQLETELGESSRAALDESGERAEKTFPDFRQVIEQHATHDRGDGNKVLPLSRNAMDALQRSDDGAAAIYAILKDGALNQLNSLPPIEAAMMVKEYEIKAQSLPKIKHVSSAPEPITSARGVASGSKSLENMNSKELLALVR